MSPRSTSPTTGWLLEGYVDDSDRLVRVPLLDFPFRIGRGADQSLRVSYANVSNEHARIEVDGDHLRLVDLDSTNGTWVNRQPVHGSCVLKHGDILHFATVEYRLVREHLADAGEHTVSFYIRDLDLPHRFHANAAGFQKMLAERKLAVAFQPIVSIEDLPVGSIEEGEFPPIAFEALGRAQIAGLPTQPDQLFAIAASVSAEAELSRLMRSRAAREACGLPGRPKVFVNTHPVETEGEILLGNLEEIRRRWPRLRLVLEIHETLVTDVDHMRSFAEKLRAMDVELAYDDFGAGQARLVELVEATPAYLKFDRSLIAGLPDAAPAKVHLVETLVKMVREFGIHPLAEGIEYEDEARICADMGFELAQGFLFGRPRPASSFR